MRVRFRGVAISLGLLIAVIALATVLFFTVPSCSHKIAFSADFYYVCYNTPPDAQTASSISSLVHGYGGAGYIIKGDGKYHVAVSCYYTDRDAQVICSSLGRKGLQCSVLKVEAGKQQLKGQTKKYSKKYVGNLNTLLSMSKMCYGLANELDMGTRDQSAAKAVLGDVKTGLESLVRQNKNNCFEDELNMLVTECGDAAGGYVRSCDVRKLQIAITDTIVNVNIY